MTRLNPHGRACFSDAALKKFREFVAVDEQTKHLRPRGAQDAMTNQLRHALKQTGVTPKQLGTALRNVKHAYDQMTGAPDPEAINAILEVLKQSLPDAGIVKIMKSLDAVWPGCCGDLVEPGEHADDDFIDDKDMTEDEDETDQDLPVANPNRNQRYFGKGTEGFDKPARDNPPPFPGMPKPGGRMVPLRKDEMASDGAMNDYFRMFPDAVRIKLNNYGPETSPTYFTPQYVRPAHAKANRKGFAMDSAEHTAANGAENDYEKMFGRGSSYVVEV